ncbi:hypothetical protein NZK33_13520 [Cyanobium sp. FGCU-6]|jgi:hypothetical protein|nr:hypothetical protein [Cyanobium sp. FGCU6]
MVTKVGSGSKVKLVCSDCGRPMDTALLAEERRRRWQAALFLGFMALGGALLFLLGSMNDLIDAGPDAQEASPAMGEDQGSRGE